MFLHEFYPNFDWVFGWSTLELKNEFVLNHPDAILWFRSSSLIWFAFEMNEEDVEIFPDGQAVFDKTKAISVKVME